MLSALLFLFGVIIVITGKTLKYRGWPEGKAIGLAKTLAQREEAAGAEAEVVLTTLDRVREHPSDYLADPRYSAIAGALLQNVTSEPIPDVLRDKPLGYAVWGAEQIEPEARNQMERALRLPVAVAGALMPDAHVGYGLPIGGVLATGDAVIPYAVGVDIACRMRLSIYPQSPIVLGQQAARFKKSLLEETRFGMNGQWDQYDRPQHAVLDDPAWESTRFLKSLKAKAQRQLGTSGSGNHFVEWGIFQLYDDDAQLNLKAGRYLALLSHSGSRGVGFKIANTYTAVAVQQHPALDKAMQYLAWLPLSSEAGQEYWLSMELAGRFAAANHEVIHQRVAKAAGLQEEVTIENHHNYAWLETMEDGSEAIVHRKGATPAGAGVLGIIPGSMGDAGYVVRGKGEVRALNSASHGAGRKMGRKAAINSITKTARDAYLQERNVTLLGGGLDESPQAYKDIEAVIAAQDDLVEILGKFTPRLVRMADEPGEF
jgi:tRNA-splicing ligase RtcB